MIGPSAGGMIALGLVALITFLVLAVFMPALLLAFAFGAVGLFVLFVYRGHPYGIYVGVALLIIAAIFGFVQVGQQASLQMARSVPLLLGTVLAGRRTGGWRFPVRSSSQ